jgi:two-component system KDP operon response regulator KdpE
VIDDEPATRDLLRLYFEDAGFAVTASAGVDEALVVLGRERPDLITLDLAMPGKDGLAFLSLHGQRASLRGIPVLVVSAADRPDRALALGADRVLAKPIRRHELLEVVADLLANAGDRHHIVVTDGEPADVAEPRRGLGG